MKSFLRLLSLLMFIAAGGGAAILMAAHLVADSRDVSSARNEATVAVIESQRARPDDLLALQQPYPTPRRSAPAPDVRAHETTWTPVHRSPEFVPVAPAPPVTRQLPSIVPAENGDAPAEQFVAPGIPAQKFDPAKIPPTAPPNTALDRLNNAETSAAVNDDVQQPTAPPALSLPAPPAGRTQTSAGPDEGPAAQPAPVGVAPLPNIAVEGSTPPAEKIDLSITRAPHDPEGDQHLSMTFHDEDLRRVLEALSEQLKLNILASANVQGTVSAALTDVDVYGALDAILKSTGYVWRRDGKFIYVGTPADFQAMNIAQDRIGTRIFRPNYVTAHELQLLITPILTTTIGKISVTSPAATGIPSDESTTGGDSFAAGDALLVQDYESVLAEIEQVVREIDCQPMQVSIEAMVLSVVLNDTTKLGVSWQFLRNEDHIRFGIGTPRTAALDGAGTPDGVGGTTGEFKFTQGGLQFAFLDSSLGAFIDALETVGDVNVVATPRLLCLDKQRAEILIGQQLGYLVTLLTETSTAQNVQFLDVGTQLRIRPFISSDGSIRMEVHPELSSGQLSAQGIPSKTLTQVTTNVMCPDGATIVIGGLMQENLETTSTQVPFIGSMPVVGPLFRTKQDKITRSELLVLVTPRIVTQPEYGVASADQGFAHARRSQTAVEQSSPLGFIHASTRYLSYAQRALARGDAKCAQRWVGLSVHFNPSNTEAVALRDQLHGLMPPSVNGAALHEQGGVPPEFDSEGEEVAPWILNDLEGEPADMIPPLYPRDPGVTGSSRAIIRPGVLEDAK